VSVAVAAPTLADPDMAINNLERFIAASQSDVDAALAAILRRPGLICCRFYYEPVSQRSLVPIKAT
jgi:hypothetical protein